MVDFSNAVEICNLPAPTEEQINSIPIFKGAVLVNGQSVADPSEPFEYREGLLARMIKLKIGDRTLATHVELKDMHVETGLMEDTFRAIAHYDKDDEGLQGLTMDNFRPPFDKSFNEVMY